MTADAQSTMVQRLRRSFLYTIGAVVASTACVFVPILIEPKTAAQNPGVELFDIAAFAPGLPLLLGWLIHTGIFGSLGSCATPTQLLGVFLTPIVSIVVDTCLVFCVWEFIHRKASRGLESENIFHING